MSKNAIIGIIAVLSLGFIGWNILNSQKSTTQTNSTQTKAPAATQSSEPQATEGAILEETGTVVKITSTGFNPKSVTLKKGESINWVNEDIEDHTVDSAIHPTHQVYPRLNLGAIKPGDKKSLSFPDTGSYKYHDHLNPTLFGSVTVE